MMKANRIHRFGPPEVIAFEEIARPAPGDGEVLVRVKAAGVGPWDAWMRAGKSVLPQPLPLTLGSDLSGVVEAIGAGAPGFARGDEIFGVTNARFTAYAVQLARLERARVIATASADDSDYVRGLRADEVIDFHSVRFEDVASPVDAVIDTVGGTVQKRSFDVLRPGGVLVSAVSRPDPAEAHRLGVRALFVLVDTTTASLSRISRMFDDGELATRMGPVMPLAEGRQAHEMLEGMRARPRGKIVLTVDG
jgi:NADPH:quinone reductase-like Zn-dependent oxidoreductase